MSFTCFRMLSTSRFHVPLTPLVKAFVRFAGPVRRKKAEFVANPLIFENIAFFIPFPAPNENHQHQRFPEYAEAGQQAACLVSGDRHHISTHLSMSNMVLFFL